MFDNLNRYISEGRYAEAEILVSSEDRSLREVFLNMACPVRIDSVIRCLKVK